MAKYDQSDFVIVGVSLDNNEASWKKAIEEDGIENWIHISSLNILMIQYLNYIMLLQKFQLISY